MVIMTVVGNKMIADTDTCPEQINKQIENKREFSWEGKTLGILLSASLQNKSQKRYFTSRICVSSKCYILHILKGS